MTHPADRSRYASMDYDMEAILRLDAKNELEWRVRMADRDNTKWESMQIEINPCPEAQLIIRDIEEYEIHPVKAGVAITVTEGKEAQFYVIGGIVICVVL